jgi:hypothetical protein
MEAPLVQDVIPLLPPKPAQLIGARLCNFPTGHSKPLPNHNAWINGDLIKATVDRHADFWIDIQAYASKTGSERLNQALSVGRREEVKRSIIAAIPTARGRFLQEIAWGESVSSGGENDNDGYWRAVEVYAYGSVPHGRMPDPAPAKPIWPIIGPPAGVDVDQWFVSNLSLSSVSFVPGFGGGGFWGTITFQQGGEDGPEFTYSMKLAGVAVGESEGLPLKEEELKFTKQILENSKIAEILKYAADNGGLSYGSAPSATAGICFPNPLRVSRLQPSDFSGECVAIFYSGNLYFVGNGIYLLFFGLPLGFWHRPSTIEAIKHNLIGPYIASQCNGVAYITSFGVGASGSVGIAANAMYGNIT